MKKGFTLIEVLSIIVILGIIAVLVLPKISTSTTDKKQKKYDKLVELIENAGKSYLSSHTTEVAVDINTLLSNKYLTNNIINPLTNTNITGCISKKVEEGINKYEFGSTCSGNINLELDLAGGSIEPNPAGVKSIGSRINLGTPTKGIYEFQGWIVENGNSIVNGNSLTIGTSHTKIKAQWGGNIEVVYNCNGGSGNSRIELHHVDTQLIENWCSKIVEGTNGMVYYFKGWATNASATEKEYEDKANVSTLVANNYPISLYAVWDELFEIAGNYEVIDDDNGNWRVKIKGSNGETFGTAGFHNNTAIPLDIFLVGGGGGGGNWHGGVNGGGGGGGGATEIATKTINPGDYVITIGAGGVAGSSGTLCMASKGETYPNCLGKPGEATTAFDYLANPGNGGGILENSSDWKWYYGGEGGAENGGNGGGGGGNGEDGTYEFGENTIEVRYGAGGGGGPTYYGDTFFPPGNGGSDGGGRGAIGYGTAINGTPNSGSGGGGALVGTPGNGGSGIVIIRNAR